jgi:hypothetical protein
MAPPGVATDANPAGGSEEAINSSSQSKIGVRQAACGVRRKGKFHLVPSDIDIRVMIHRFRFAGHFIHEIDGP